MDIWMNGWKEGAWHNSLSLTLTIRANDPNFSSLTPTDSDMTREVDRRISNGTLPQLFIVVMMMMMMMMAVIAGM